MNALEKAAEEQGLSIKEMSIRILKNMVFPIHAEIVYDKTFKLSDFFARCEEIIEILPKIDLDEYQEHIVNLMNTNPSRKVPLRQAYQIYGRVWALQAMARMKLEQRS